MPLKTRAKKRAPAGTRTVLLTGADNFLGRLVLQRLNAERSVGTVLVLGPTRGRKVRSLKVPLLDPKLVDVLRAERIDAVAHLDLVSTDGRDDAIFEHNVLGTLNLLESAARSGVRRVVIRSSTLVYGLRPTNPNFLHESRRIRLKGGRSQYVRDSAEMERYVLEYCQHDRDVECALLRFAPIAGPTSDEPLMRYLRRPPCPVFLGFDPLFQLLHEEDAADAVIHALGSGLRGPVNICPDGVAPLLQILRRLGRDHFSVPHPLVGVGERLFPRLRALPLDSGMLRHTLGGDNARMKDELGFAPKRTTAETLDDLQGRI